ncbi:KfrA domain-containing protein DNA-binding domain protein [Paracidovorax avenae ATCC 19860]|uniref:KfrA domain-containing protein DNA-binding domain protein n=1 Tax=Paracidovorax avenae (strain ATCC 19860 / DSM 7227 / CCUG 15838 / JCM 20985 / LMG 2117 / NCPPB 1011) TaxID=643561 RepID=F0QDE9_PARA1|nr:DNA-binding protein [Paracidovorax avenae]ADX46394.1 KfrA domain-containing protein DNA-binding domain protein [Paracidovorax avenae ATCC 19860]AVS67415.1 DNA-binding protein [Paracidovorax avenae]
MPAKMLRGPRGVQMEEVWAAADAVLALGERPTVERVRHQLGRGSPNTVGPMLDSWYATLARRLQAPADASDPGEGAGEALPAPVARAAKALWARALQQADESATARLAQSRAGLDAQAEALRLIQDELAREKQRLDDRGEAYVVALQARDAQIAEAARQAQELQQQLLACQQLLDSARSDNTQLRKAADADRKRQEARDADHQAERARLEERAQAQERRLHAEVDRARQESRRLALQLEAEQKKSAKALSDAQDRARELEAQVGTLHADNAKLAQDLLAVRDEARQLQRELDDRSSEMLAMLSELKDRLPVSPSKRKAIPARIRKAKE